MFLLRNILRPSLQKSALSGKCPVDITAPPTFPHTKCTLMPNGIRVATEESGSAMATITLFIEAGPRFENACNNGITHFIEHMAYKGFQSMNKYAFEESVIELGAKFSAKTSREICSFSCNCFPEAASKVLNVYKRILTELELSDYNMESEKKNISLELQDAEGDPKKVVFDYLHSTAYQGTPLAQSVMGPSRNYRRFDRETVLQYMAKQFQPWRLVIAGSGGLEHTDFVLQTQSVLANYVGNLDCTDQDLGPTRFTGSQVMYRDDSMPFAHVCIAVEVPGYTSGDYLPLLVAKNIIGSWDRSQGGGEGNATRLARAGDLGRVCESYEAFYIVYRDTGLWGIYFVADKMDIEDMLFNIQDAWMKMTITTTQSEIDRAINLLKLQLAQYRCGTIFSCYDIGEQMMYTCKRDSLQEFYSKLKGIKPNIIQSLGEKYIYDQCPALAAVGPVEGVPDYTRIRAGMYWLRF